MPEPGRLYGALFETLAVRLDPERAHHLAGALIRMAGALAPLRWALSRTLGRPPATGAQLFGRRLPSRFGLAAGFDKDATMVAGLAALGFAAVEIGTVTAHAQPGNPRPRLFRVLGERALVNRMGFNNDGADAVARRLHALRSTTHGRRLVLGANIGKSKITPAEEAADDYRASARALAPYVDYLVVNVSSPNTPGLRDLQAVDSLAPILRAVLDASTDAARRGVPVLVKIAPDLADDDVREVARLAARLGLAGVVTANTTVQHDHGVGGLSGPPLLARGVEVTRIARGELGPDAVVIGVGGVSDADDAAAYLEAGADLVQAYTGFIYLGPAWPGRVARGLAHSAARVGSES